ncbi:hypothetical protein JCM1841_006792 [Sporobolomyces salmonicolor]
MAPSSGLSISNEAHDLLTPPAVHRYPSEAPSIDRSQSQSGGPPPQPSFTPLARQLIPIATDEWTAHHKYAQPSQPVQHSTRPYLTERHRSTSAPNMSPHSSSAPPRARRVPPPPRPIFPPPEDDFPASSDSRTASSHVQDGGEPATNEDEEGARLERREQAMLRGALEASRRDSLTRVHSTGTEEDDAQLQQAMAASRADFVKAQRIRVRDLVKIPPTLSQQQEQADLAAALAASVRTARRPSSSSPAASTSTRRHRSVSNPEPLPAFSPSDLARPYYPPEKQRLFPQGRPRLPPGAAVTYDDEQREMEMLTLAIRMSEEEERTRQECEERELSEVVRRYEEWERASRTQQRRAPPPQVPRRPSPPNALKNTDSVTPVSTTASAPASPNISPKKQYRSSWLRAPLASKLSTSSPPVSPPTSPVISRRTTRPSLDSSAAPTDSAQTVTTYRTVPEPSPFSNLSRIQTRPSSSFSSLSHGPAPAPLPPRRLPPPPPSQQPTRLPPSPPETPFVPSIALPTPPATSIPLPFAFQATEAYRRTNAGSPFEMPFLTPTTSIRSVGVGEPHDEVARRFSASYSGSGGTGSHEADGSRKFSGGTGDCSSPPSSRSRSDEDYERSSGGNGGEGSSESIMLEVRNPDSKSFADALPGGAHFENAYAGRSMSAIDEQTEPASSVFVLENGEIGTQGMSKQGSWLSNVGSGMEQGVVEVMREAGGEQQPVHGDCEEQEWLRRGPLPAEGMERHPYPKQRISTVPSFSAGATSSTHYSPALSSISIDRQFSFPAPPGSTSSALSPISMSASPSAAASLDRQALPIGSHTSLTATADDPVDNDGTRLGYPSICARSPGHVCPDDGLSASRRGMSDVIELTSGEEDERIGLGLSGGAARERTGSKRIVKDMWAVEARSWVGLLRFLMWYGDTRIAASSADFAFEATQHCSATATLEFRPDDEGYTVLRLGVALLPPDDPSATARYHAHGELTVEHPGELSGSGKGKGKGKSRSYFTPSSPDKPLLATFHLADVLNLPSSLSSLAIQLYTLRHLASIARSTQPAKEGPAAGYLALRELSDAIEALSMVSATRKERAASSRVRRGSSGVVGSEPGSGPAQGAGGRGAFPVADENERLLDRIRDRLRRLKLSSTTNNGRNSPSRPNKLLKPPPKDYVPTVQRVQQVSRSERILSVQMLNEPELEDRGQEEESWAVVREVERPAESQREGERERERRRAESGDLQYLRSAAARGE